MNLVNNKTLKKQLKIKNILSNWAVWEICFKAMPL